MREQGTRKTKLTRSFHVGAILNQNSRCHSKLEFNSFKDLCGDSANPNPIIRGDLM